MQEIAQHTSLASVGDEVFLFVNMSGSRHLMHNEKQSNEHPFIKFVNASDLSEFMIALDEIYETYEYFEFISDLSGTKRPSPIGLCTAASIAKLFDSNPTRTTIQRTREAIEVWRFENMRPSDDIRLDTGFNSEAFLYTCMPLKDLIEARNDLKRTSKLMAWLLGKCSFEMTHDLKPGDKTAVFKTLDMENEDTLLGGYYARLRKNTGNALVDLQLTSSIRYLHLYKEKDIERTARSYVEAAFSLLLSDETKKLSRDLKPYSSNNTILSAIWSFFATGLACEGGAESIAICKHCGRYFQPKRITKQFCSDSCRVLYMRQNSSNS